MRRTMIAAVLGLGFLAPTLAAAAGPARVFVRHAVNDYAAWRPVYDGFGAAHDKKVVLAQAVYRSADDPNDVTVTHDFASLEKAQAFMAAPELKATMEKSGVKGEPSIWITMGKPDHVPAKGVVRVFIQHEVADVVTWRKAYDGFDVTRRKLGVIAQSVYMVADKPTNVIVTHDFKTLAAAKAFAGSDELKNVMAKAGVVGQPQVWFTQLAR